MLSDDDIRSKTEDVFGKRPCDFQIKLCRAQLEHKNIISIAATGSGKTLSYLMTLPLTGIDSVLIIVTALNVLGDQFEREAQSAGFSAISVNAENDTDEVFTNIKNLKYRVVIFSPNIMVKRGGRCQKFLWPDKKFISKVLNIIFDEAHCIPQWGNTFRPEYGQVGDLMWHLPGVPIYLSSATIPSTMITELKEKFNLSDNYVMFQRSNDRPNIALVVKRMVYAQGSFEDLGFLVPKDWKTSQPLPQKFMIFFDNKREAEGAAAYLTSRVSLQLRDKIPWFHAGMTRFFRVEEIELFCRTSGDEPTGGVWGFAATDSGGMGLDIADVKIVVQWKVPKSLNTLMQRFGRAARNPLLQGIAILLAEPSWFYEERLALEQRKRKRKKILADVDKQTNTNKRVRISPSPLPSTVLGASLQANAVHANPTSVMKTISKVLTTETSPNVALPCGPSTIILPTTGPNEDSESGLEDDEHAGLVVEESEPEDQVSLPAIRERVVVDEETVEALMLGSDAKNPKKIKNFTRKAPHVSDRALCMFINAHVLQGPQRCRRYHPNIFYGNDKAGQSHSTFISFKWTADIAL
ncbi:hypothetical protein PHLCEN_2v1999 [Hermanssonia centrifuga]|uniref:DNA 3'-5' helicase n=1 Tax=Hermanssonia centrifuga TaxID=98765 RepID=A0A2R6RQE0_9APHY|nr:hypothetical protein PHLCEN_2v1999 [Hermanssonia centrifuga]